MVCCGNRIPRGVKICCAITTILVIIIVVVAVVLFVTVLKPKKPNLTTKSVTLDNIRLEVLPIFRLNVTLGIVVTVDNHRNYGSFKYDNSTVFVYYRKIQAAQAPVQADTIPARARHDVSATVTVVGDNLFPDPSFWVDLNSGVLNFTSSVSLHGKATAWKILKVKLTTFTTCNISVFIATQNASSFCQSKLMY
ncbi:OLC1v1021975C1 [Oldenlandia corymbosa var. corymbosa]|uniref:OLC1v1021975C1 n=1 Tax=Oldenlandia corymbosa var. corymbosa TaxID=529605 RepID=A0AAV1BXG4_OLDCO|nr:OLC1v1021975C1 [Oldenlandia corymbosa var. corymbosa]